MKIFNKSPLCGKFRMIRVTPDDVRIYKNIDGHKFGVVFTEELAFDNSIGGDVGGFGPTLKTAIHFEYDGDVNG